MVFSLFVSSVLPQWSRLPWLLAPSSEVETGLSMLGGSLLTGVLRHQLWTSRPVQLRKGVMSDCRIHFCGLQLGILLSGNLC